MRSAPVVQTRCTGDYVVVAPQITDFLSGTLRAAYGVEPAACAQFSDLISQLEMIDATPIPR
ncbi:hypothetical protein [Sphingomonas psychrolutea]|uniref:hypothetical protein n=1 Tax=Sphingomonas psychrolutea TaxID=1259676 RepID=UPI0016661B58|nr:hypothetical protein [Sphingomonas psychrolutea]